MKLVSSEVYYVEHLIHHHARHNSVESPQKDKLGGLEGGGGTNALIAPTVPVLLHHIQLEVEGKGFN